MLFKVEIKEIGIGMNIGDKIVCVDNDSDAYFVGDPNKVNLTIGKVYIVCHIAKNLDNIDLIFVEDDFGEKGFYSEKRFVSLGKNRKDKLLKLNLI
jgi:hypothetical protein